jgi:hypothetical protein
MSKSRSSSGFSQKQSRLDRVRAAAQLLLGHGIHLSISLPFGYMDVDAAEAEAYARDPVRYVLAIEHGRIADKARECGVTPEQWFAYERIADGPPWLRRCGAITAAGNPCSRDLHFHGRVSEFAHGIHDRCKQHREPAPLAAPPIDDNELLGDLFGPGPRFRIRGAFYQAAGR